MDNLELKLHRQALRESAMPQIKRRLIQDHLGQRKYVYRIEITLLGQEFYLEKSEASVRHHSLVLLCARIKQHVCHGKMLNLQHWKPILYTY